MKRLTLSNFLNEYDKSLTTIASETKLSISLLSKIKDGTSSITKRTQNIFRSVYGIELILVSETEKLKVELEKRENINKELQNKIESLNTDLLIAQNKSIDASRKSKLILSIINCKNLSEKKELEIYKILNK